MQSGTYRNVATELTKALPLEDAEFRHAVKRTLASIRKMPKAQRNALGCAFIFSRKVPRDDREDVFQELVVALLELNTEDEALAYSVARRDWQDWWKRYYTRSHYMAGSVNETITNSEDQETELAELVVGEAEFERKECEKLDCQRLWSELPVDIKPLVLKRLKGKGLPELQRKRLNYWAKKNGHLLLAAR